MLNKTKRKQAVKFYILTVLAIIFIFLALIFHIIPTENEDIYDYIITISSVMGGFMFAGLGILVSAISVPNIKRFWDGHYLDNLYRASILGLMCDILAMLLSFVVLYVNKATLIQIASKIKFINPELVLNKAKILIEYTDIVCASMGLIYFIWSILVLIKIFNVLKKDRF